jgi:hypothetical protein
MEEPNIHLSQNDPGSSESQNRLLKDDQCLSKDNLQGLPSWPMMRAFKKLTDLKMPQPSLLLLWKKKIQRNVVETFFLRITLKIIAKIATMGSVHFFKCLV